MFGRVRKPKRKRSAEEKRKTSWRILIGLFGVLVLVSLYYKCGLMGTAKVKLETDHRKEQQVPEEWTTTGEAGKRLAAYLSYPEDAAEEGKHIAALYYVKGGFATGWFFRFGGSVNEIRDGIVSLQAGNKTEELAYYSMNNDKAVKVVLYQGTDKEETRSIDPDKPFAIVLPGKAVPVFYDAAGSEIKCIGPVQE